MGAGSPQFPSVLFKFKNRIYRLALFVPVEPRSELAVLYSPVKILTKSRGYPHHNPSPPLTFPCNPCHFEKRNEYELVDNGREEIEKQAPGASIARWHLNARAQSQTPNTLVACRCLSSYASNRSLTIP